MRFPRTALLAVAALAVVPTVLSTPAHAHVELRESDPPAGGTAPTGTEEIVLRFISLDTTEPVEVTVTGPGGEDVVAAPPLVLEDGTVEVAVEPLGEGEHTVAWSAMPADGDGEAEGSFTFTAESSGGGYGVWLLWFVALAIPALILLRPGRRKPGSRETV